MEELCPDAVLLKLCQPNGRVLLCPRPACRTCRSSACATVFKTTLDLISRYVDTPKDRIDYLCAGINHMGWFLRLRDTLDGRDLYPLLKKNIEKPEYFVNEKVRGEVMRHFWIFHDRVNRPSLGVHSVVPQSRARAQDLVRSARLWGRVGARTTTIARCSRRNIRMWIILSLSRQRSNRAAWNTVPGFLRQWKLTGPSG